MDELHRGAHLGSEAAGHREGDGRSSPSLLKSKSHVAGAACLTVAPTQRPSLGLQHATGCPRGWDWQCPWLPSSEQGPARGSNMSSG